MIEKQTNKTSRKKIVSRQNFQNRPYTTGRIECKISPVHSIQEEIGLAAVGGNKDIFPDKNCNGLIESIETGGIKSKFVDRQRERTSRTSFNVDLSPTNTSQSNERRKTHKIDSQHEQLRSVQSSRTQSPRNPRGHIDVSKPTRFPLQKKRKDKERILPNHSTENEGRKEIQFSSNNKKQQEKNTLKTPKLDRFPSKYRNTCASSSQTSLRDHFQRKLENRQHTKEERNSTSMLKLHASLRANRIIHKQNKSLRRSN